MPNVNNKGADQPEHLHSLISASSFYTRNFNPLPSFCDCAGRFESTPKTGFLVTRLKYYNDPKYWHRQALINSVAEPV